MNLSKILTLLHNCYFVTASFVKQGVVIQKILNFMYVTLLDCLLPRFRLQFAMTNYNYATKPRIFMISFLIAVTCSCGFESIYNLDNKVSNTDTYEEELAAIKIKKERKRINQVLRNNLEDALNPDNIKTEPKYLLEITLFNSISSTFITTTGASGRNKVILNANYKLTDLASGQIIATGISTATDDFDVEGRRFANYITEEAIELNLTKIIAKNIRNLLVGDITNFIKNGRKVRKEETTELSS